MFDVVLEYEHKHSTAIQSYDFQFPPSSNLVSCCSLSKLLLSVAQSKLTSLLKLISNHNLTPERRDSLDGPGHSHPPRPGLRRRRARCYQGGHQAHRHGAKS